jgi:hypothetical protein
MRFVPHAAFALALLALAGCGGSDGEGSAADDVSERAEQMADGYEAAAGDMDNEAAADALKNQAEVIRRSGERREEALEKEGLPANAS